MAGGWRIVKTMGQRITRLRPVSGFAAETAAAISLFGTAAGRHSRHHDARHRRRHHPASVRRNASAPSTRGVTRRIIWAWLLTIPGAGPHGRRLLPSPRPLAPLAANLTTFDA